MEFGKLAIRNISTLIGKKNTVFRNPKKRSVGVISIFIKTRGMNQTHIVITVGMFQEDVHLTTYYADTQLILRCFNICPTIHNSIKKLNMKKTFAKKVVVNIKCNVFDAPKMCMQSNSALITPAKHVNCRLATM